MRQKTKQTIFIGKGSNIAEVVKALQKCGAEKVWSYDADLVRSDSRETVYKGTQIEFYIDVLVMLLIAEKWNLKWIRGIWCF